MVIFIPMVESGSKFTQQNQEKAAVFAMSQSPPNKASFSKDLISFKWGSRIERALEIRFGTQKRRRQWLVNLPAHPPKPPKRNEGLIASLLKGTPIVHKPLARSYFWGWWVYPVHLYRSRSGYPDSNADPNQWVWPNERTKQCVGYLISTRKNYSIITIDLLSAPKKTSNK